MADFFYSGQSCCNSNHIDFISASTQYSIGDVVQVQINPPFPIYECYSIFALSNSGNTPAHPIYSIDIDCISCVQSTVGVFGFTSCVDQTNVQLDVNNFSFVPNFGGVYYITTQNGNNGCYQFIGCFDGSSTDTLLTISIDYTNCNSCIVYNIPYSANTEYSLCVLDCSGNTVTLDFPHPVWTNNYGNSVTQLDAVQLGGQNGLNN